MAGWESFFVTDAGAAAALAGLVFVGISINLARIIEYPTLPGRGLEAIIVLLAVLLVSSLLLVPEQSLTAMGIEVLACGLAVWLTVVGLHIRAVRHTQPQYYATFLLRVVLAQLASLPLLVASERLLRADADGIYWIVPAFVFSFIVALSNAWVLLIEINR